MWERPRMPLQPIEFEGHGEAAKRPCGSN